jgi:nucleotide-binding universal stress UspA family protein
MFTRIAVAWDGSPPARRAFDAAVGLARRYRAELVAVGIAHSPTHAETEEDRLESAEAARRYIEESFAAVRNRAELAGVAVTLAVVDGDEPPRDILRYVEEHGFDLVVTGHHRARRLGRFALRGVAERLAAQSGVPVLVVGSGGGE